jgi:hypothetical protein
MIISNGINTKNLTLYSSTQPLLQDDQVVWLDLGDDDPEVNFVNKLIMIS